jgi:maltose-binding protein MalE
MEHIRKSLVLTLILCLMLAMLPVMAEEAQPFYKTLDPNTEGSIDIMVWSGDSTYYEDIGAKEWAPEDMTSQNVAAVHALAKQFKQLYPKVKVNLWAKTDDPHGNGTSWYQEMENFKAQHGKHPDIYASTDLAGDVSLGLVADLTPFKDDPLYQTFNPSIMALMNYYGFQAGLPQFLQPWGVYINKELAENNNIDVPEPNWTIDDYTAFVNSADNKTFWGAMDTPLSFIATGTTAINYRLNKYDGEGDYVDLASDEVAKTLSYVPEWAKSSVWAQFGLGNVPQEIMDDGWWWGFRFFCRNYILTLDGDPWMIGAASGGKNEDGTWKVNAVESGDWDIYPRPATEFRGNTMGIVIDPMAIHNYAMDDNDPAWSEEEIAKLQLAYAFGSFWCGATEGMKARVEMIYSDNGAPRSALNDSLPLVTGPAFDEQMAIWGSTKEHARYLDKDLMPGFQYVLELWEKGEMWDISDKTYLYHIIEDGTRVNNLREWLSATNAEVLGVGTTDANWLDTVKAKLGDWNETINARFVKAEGKLKEGLMKYYGLTEEELK